MAVRTAPQKLDSCCRARGRLGSYGRANHIPGVRDGSVGSARTCKAVGRSSATASATATCLAFGLPFRGAF